MTESKHAFMVHESIFVLIFRLLAINFIFGLIVYILTWQNLFVFSGAWINTALIIGLVYNFYLIFGWTKNYYFINQKKISHFFGVFIHQHRTVRFPTLDTIRLKQSIFGQIFNYGSILLASSETEQQIWLHHIPQPHQYLKQIKSLLPGAEQF